MTTRRPPRLAVALLTRHVPDSEALLGDLTEEFQAGRSSLWFWRQVFGAMAIAAINRPREVRPLRLVDEADRSLPLKDRLAPRDRELRPINLSASPLGLVGGLGLVTMAVMVAIVFPEAWLFVVIAVPLGVICGFVMVTNTRRRVSSSTHRPPRTIQ
jgi:hypothetical protein